GGIVVDERAAALSAGHDALDLHEIERLADGSAADAELLGEVRFIGKGRPRLPMTHHDPLHQYVAHLKVERPRRKPSVQVCHAIPPRLEMTEVHERVASST